MSTEKVHVTSKSSEEIQVPRVATSDVPVTAAESEATSKARETALLKSVYPTRKFEETKREKATNLTKLKAQVKIRVRVIFASLSERNLLQIRLRSSFVFAPQIPDANKNLRASKKNAAH